MYSLRADKLGSCLRTRQSRGVLLLFPERGSPGRRLLWRRESRSQIHDVPAVAGMGSSTILGQSLGCPKQGVAGPMNKAGSGVTAQISEMTKSF